MIVLTSRETGVNWPQLQQRRVDTSRLLQSFSLRLGLLDALASGQVASTEEAAKQQEKKNQNPLLETRSGA